MKNILRHLATLMALSALAACASYPPKVICDGKLRPINLPPPPAVGASSSKAPRAADAETDRIARRSGSSP